MPTPTGNRNTIPFKVTTDWITHQQNQTDEIINCIKIITSGKPWSFFLEAGDNPGANLINVLPLTCVTRWYLALTPCKCNEEFNNPYLRLLTFFAENNFCLRVCGLQFIDFRF